MRIRTPIAVGFAIVVGLGAAQSPPPNTSKINSSQPDSLPSAPAPTWEPDFRLVYESDTRAYYRPCGCSQNSAGGLSRRVALLKDERAQPAPVLLCTAGDFYGTADVFNEAKSRFVARMLGEMGYDAIGVGEMDLNFGLNTLVADAREYKLPLVCANLAAAGDSLRVRDGGPAAATADRLGSAFPPYRIVTKKGTRFGFLGLISPSTKVKPSPSDVPSEAVNYSISDPVVAAQSVVPELRASCDVVIVLAHMGQEEAARLAQAVPGIDLVVMGHDPTGRPLGIPEKVGSAYLLRATSQGQNIGELSLKLGADRRLAEVHNRLHVLDATYPDDPAMTKKIAGFEEENKKIQKELFARQQVRGSSADAFGGRYLGVGACQSCHVDAFNVYEHTRHAHAYATLASQFVHRDTNCVGCHVTGFEDEGGFAGVRMRGATVDLIDVQCEACHGPASNHSRDGSYRASAVQSCVKCHTPNDDPDFDFATDWPKIAH
jgi:2',3'-cyclic-nucleotide 2'-phosphodiesterase (5'-nucleotidase family)